VKIRAENPKTSSFLTTGQVARRCGVNFRTVIRWIQKGYLKAHRLPGQRADRRIAIEDFERFVAKNQLGRAAKPDSVPVVLVVHGDPVVGRSLQKTVARVGCRALLAADAFAAGLALADSRPNLIVLELRAKGWDGLPLVKSIRAREELKTTPILVLSSDSLSRLREAGSLGASAPLARPFRPSELTQKVRELLELEVPHVK
jgi:two-component system response regulator VicR